MSEESIKILPGSDNNFVATLINSYPLPDAKFSRNCLMNNKSEFRKVINIYISYSLDSWSGDLIKDFTLGYCLFGVLKFTKNAHPDKYGYSGYDIRFDACSQFSLPDCIIK